MKKLLHAFWCWLSTRETSPLMQAFYTQGDLLDPRPALIPIREQDHHGRH